MKKFDFEGYFHLSKRGSMVVLKFNQILPYNFYENEL